MPKSEVVLVAGPPGGGKTTSVKALTDQGYARFNRDTLGGSIDKGGAVWQAMVAAYASGTRSFVMDNLFHLKKDRLVYIELAKQWGLPIRILWLDTTAEQAQFFAARRQMQRYGKILRAEDYKKAPYKGDPNCFPPVVQFSYWKKLELPTPDEGYDSLEHVPVKISLGPEYVNKAVIFDFDDTLRRTPKPDDLYPKKPEDVILLPGRKEKLQALKAQGMILLGASNSSGCSREPGDPMYVSEPDAVRCYDYTCELLGVKIDYMFAPERGGVPQSYLRKPLVGMAVTFIEAYKLDPAKVLMVGDMTSDRTFAERAGFQFAWAKDYFGC